MVRVNMRPHAVGIDSLYNAFEECRPKNGDISYGCIVSGKKDRVPLNSLESSVLDLPLDSEQRESISKIIDKLCNDKTGFYISGRWYEGLLVKGGGNDTPKKTDLVCFTEYGDSIYAICKLDGKIKGKDHILLLLNIDKHNSNLNLSYSFSNIKTSDEHFGSGNSTVSLLIEFLKGEIEENLKQSNN